MGRLESLEQCYDDHADAMYGFLWYLLRDDSEVRDVIQDLFCRIAERPEILANVKNERSFLIRMVHRMVLDRFRRQDARLRAHETLGNISKTFVEPSTNQDANSIQNELTHALKSLPSEQSAVIHLKLREEMTFEQIAEALDIPPNTAASRYRYGIEKLRSQLKPLYEEIN